MSVEEKGESGRELNGYQSSTNVMAKSLLLYERLIDSLTQAQSRQVEQQQFLQSENKELIRFDRERETQLREERQKILPEFYSLQRELLEWTKRAQTGGELFDSFTMVCEAMAKLIDVIEREFIQKVQREHLVTPFKLSNLIELYCWVRGLKPDSLVGKVFGEDMLILKKAMTAEEQVVGPVSKMTHKKRKRESLETKYSYQKETKNVCEVEIQVRLLDEKKHIDILITKQNFIRSVYLCRPKENVLERLNAQKFTVIDLVHYYQVNYATQSKNRSLIFLAFPEEQDKLPLVICGKMFQSNMVVGDRPPTYFFSQELQASNVVRFQEAKAAFSQWSLYCKHLPLLAGLKSCITKADEKSTWKGKILHALHNLKKTYEPPSSSS